MLPEQIAVKLIQEATSEIPSKSSETAEAKGQIKVINEYVRIENMIFSKLSDLFGAESVRPNQQIKDSGVDALVRINRSDRALFEIKYYKKPAQLSQRINDVTQVLARAVKSYKAVAPYHNTFGVGLIILGDGFSKSAKENISEITATVIDDVYIRIITIAESEFMKLTSAEFKSMISNAPESKYTERA
jgi:hypothetical protein